MRKFLKWLGLSVAILLIALAVLFLLAPQIFYIALGGRELSRLPGAEVVLGTERAVSVSSLAPTETTSLRVSGASVTLPWALSSTTQARTTTNDLDQVQLAGQRAAALQSSPELLPRLRSAEKADLLRGLSPDILRSDFDLQKAALSVRRQDLSYLSSREIVATRTSLLVLKSRLLLSDQVFAFRSPQSQGFVSSIAYGNRIIEIFSLDGRKKAQLDLPAVTDAELDYILASLQVQ